MTDQLDLAHSKEVGSIANVLAGMSVAGLVLPEAIAYSGIANLPPIAGILSACIGLLIYAIAGANRFAVVAATSSSAVLLAAAIHALNASRPVYAAELAAGLVMLTGLVFLVCSVFRLGRMAHFIARPVVRGLAFGLAIVIVIKQLTILAGVTATRSDAFGILFDVLCSARDWHIASLIFGVSALVALWLMARWPHIPGPFLVIVAGIIANHWLATHMQAVPVVGPVSLSTIKLAFPAVELDDWLPLGRVAVALALILFAESYSAMRVFALKHGDTVNSNRELAALGVANLFAGLCHAMPVGAGYSATSANEASGAHSKAAGLVSGLCVVIAALGLLRYVEQIPQVVLSAIIIYAMRHALDPGPLRVYFQWHRDQLTVIVAVLAVLLFGVLDGLLAAIAVSLILLVKGFAAPRLTQLGQLGTSHDFVNLHAHSDARVPVGALILRPEEPLFFANVSEVLESAVNVTLRGDNIRILILSLEESPDIDGTTIEALEQFAQRLVQSKRLLLFARLKDPVFNALQLANLAIPNSVVLSQDSVATVVALAQELTHAQSPAHSSISA
jgi:MFS superfamily sulfate permease-like transporter